MKLRALWALVLVGWLAVPAGRAGAQWAQTNGPYGGNVWAFAKIGGYLFAATDAGVYRSNNNGSSWILESNGIKSNNPVFSLTTMGSILFAGTQYYGVYKSTDSGTSWSLMTSNSNLYYEPSSYVGILTSFGTTLYAGTWGSGLFSSIDRGATWIAINPKAASGYVASIVYSGANIILGTYAGGSGKPGGAFRSTDNGISWVAASPDLGNQDVLALAADSGANVYACTSDSLFRSTDHGERWTKAHAKLPGNYVHSILLDGSNLFVSTENSGVFRSTDSGASWTSWTAGITNSNVLTLFAGGSTLYAGTAGAGVFESTDRGAHWITMSDGIVSTSITALISNDGSLIAAADGAGIFRSTDSGTNWTNSGLANMHVFTFSNIGQILFAGTDSGVFRSTNNGTSWAAANSGITGTYLDISEFAVIGTNLFVRGPDTIPVLRSTDSGSTWMPASSGLPEYVSSLTALGPQLFAYVNNVSIRTYTSMDSGRSWKIDSNALAGGPTAITQLGTVIFEKGNGSYSRSTDHGKTWVPSNVGIYGDIGQLLPFDSDLFLTDGYTGVYCSTDSGSQWVPDTVGLMVNNVVALAVDGRNLFAGTGHGVWRTRAVPPYVLSVSADTLDFGTVPVGKASLRTVTVQNVGGFPLRIQFTQINSMQTAFGTSDLSSPVDLLSGESFTFEVYFRPQTAGRVAIGLEIVSEDNAVNLTLIGRAYGGDAVAEELNGHSVLTTYPNPFSQSAKISFSLAEAEYADVSIVNALGAEVARLFSGTLGAGEHEFSWNPDAAAPGNYWCIVRTSEGVQRIGMLRQ